jgi:hypothetical protein
VVVERWRGGVIVEAVMREVPLWSMRIRKAFEIDSTRGRIYPKGILVV